MLSAHGLLVGLLLGHWVFFVGTVTTDETKTRHDKTRFDSRLYELHTGGLFDSKPGKKEEGEEPEPEPPF